MGKLLLRVLVGLLFVGHGTQKLFGWFGGDGLDETANAFESMGLGPGKQSATAAGAAEAGGGLLLALGLATPLAAASVIGVMLTAIRKVHFQNGVWVTEGGFEYNAVLIAAVTLLAEAGPGRCRSTGRSASRSAGLCGGSPHWPAARLRRPRFWLERRGSVRRTWPSDSATKRRK
jgi:putative oxidoreductase